MPRYFFDTNDGRLIRDEEGVTCASIQEAALEAKKLLPAIARDEMPRNGERHAITVLVTDEDGRAVYSASIAYLGTWLLR